MADRRVEVTCIRCQHKFWVDLDELDEPGPVVYRLAQAPVSTNTYRVTCPACGERFKVTVQEETNRE